MKAIKLTLFSMVIACVLLACKKGDAGGGSDCEDNNTTKVTFTNTGSHPLRVELATSLTPQFVPINPIFSLDLAAGATVVKEFEADQYFIVWYSNCSSTCTMMTYYSKTYTQCSEYEEKQGF